MDKAKSIIGSTFLIGSLLLANFALVSTAAADPDPWPGVCDVCTEPEGDKACCRATVCTEAHEEPCCEYGFQCRETAT